MYKVIEENNETLLVEEPASNYGYSYADYLQWKIEERLEIIKGQLFKMSAPNRLHQDISGNIFISFAKHLKGMPCKVYAAPFDVRLPNGLNRKDENVKTVVQPDICVICDITKLDDKGCCGAPDLIVEILSPGNNKKELLYKYNLYQEVGVSEYWIINPNEQNLIIYTLVNGFYKSSKLFTSGETISSTINNGFSLNVEDIFEQ